MPLVFRFCDGKVVSKVCNSLHKEKWLEEKLKACLLLSDTREAIILADKYKILDKYARLRSKKESEIRDGFLCDFGFDNNGKIHYDLGSKQIEVSLNKDFSLSVFDLTNDKEIKSIPQKGVDEKVYKEVSGAFAETKKTIKKTAKSKFESLRNEFLSGKAMPSKKWIESYLENAFLRQVAELVVWSQDDKTFTLKDGKAINSEEKPYEINGNTIRVAHPMEMRQGDVLAWQNYFVSNKLKQAFEQIWEPVYQAEDITKDRYAKAEIPLYRFLNQEKHGIHTKRDFYDFESEAEITMADCDIESYSAEGVWSKAPNDLYVISSFSFKKYTRQVNHIVAYLEKITIHDKIEKDDVSIANFLHGFNLKQILEFIDLASKNNSVNVLSLLLNYKNERFGDFNDALILEL